MVARAFGGEQLGKSATGQGEGGAGDECTCVCTGVAVHKETVEAHLRGMEPGGRLWQQTRRWGRRGPDSLKGKR